jgi:hypothetical protein
MSFFGALTMKSITSAMAWELLASGRWALAASGVGMVAIPVLVMTSLASIARLDPQDQTLHTLHLLFMQANIVGGIVTLLGLAYQSTRPLFPQPATSSALTRGRMLPAAGLLAAQVILWSVAINVACRLDWPVWEPALFAVATLTASFAVLWCCYGSHWMILGLIMVAAIFGYWTKSHFGSMFDMPKHAWSPMGVGEGVALLGITLASYWLAVVGFARTRRGEPPLSLGIVAWLNALPERRLSAAAVFASSLAAQRWYFRRHMWIAPAAVLGGSLPSIVLWGIVSGDLQPLMAGFAVSCWGLCAVTFIAGLILGSLGTKGDVVLGQFLATRPLTTAEMARELLRTAAIGCLLAWVVWGILFGIVFFMSWMLRYAPAEMLPKEFNVGFLAAAIVVSWGVMGCVMTIALAGRAQLVFRAMLAFGAVIVLGIPAGKYALTPLAADRLYGAIVSMTCMAVVGGTIWSLWLANKRELITRRAVGLSVVAWAALASCAALAIPFGPTPSLLHWLFSWLLLFGSTALIVAPIAAAPLALAWNRTR